MKAINPNKTRVNSKPAGSLAGWMSPTRLRTQKSMAKIGMAGSLGTLFVSGFFKFHGAKQLHIYSGLGLLAFTLWHHVLNQPRKRPRS